MKKRTVQFCRDKKICCSCGFCVDVCPVKAIQIKEQNYLFTPNVDKSKCINCGICYELCSGKGNNWYKKTELKAMQLNIKTQFEEDIGFYNSCFIAHSTDFQKRFHCASGGVTTSLLIFLLNNKLIDGAVVTRFSRNNPLDVETFIATTENEILEAKSSKYCPVHMDGIINKIRNFPGKVAFVGLPCQLQTLSNIEDKDQSIKEKIFIHIGLFCSGSKDSRALNFLLKNHNLPKEGIVKFSYRDEGCLGNVKVVYNKDCKSIPYKKAYSILHSYFKPERCVTCIDHFAFFADISLGDIDCEPYNEDKIGSNSVIIRSDVALDIFNKARLANIIKYENIPVKEIIRSQRVLFYRKSLYTTYSFLQKMKFNNVPNYDKYPNTHLSIKGFVWVISYIVQRLLSKLRFGK